MPALSPTMEEGTLTKWHIKAGDTVSAGQVIAEIETDKATMEVEAVDEGEVLEILVAEGSENVKVNTPIARLAGENGVENSTTKSGDSGDSAKATSETSETKAAAEGKTGDPEKASSQTAGPKVELRDPEIPADAKLVKTTRDPIDHIKTLLAAAKATEDELKAIDNEVKAIVAEAVQFAQESPEPDPSELYTDVYVEA